ncbi:DNA-directed RNA polymerase II subunit RPB9 [Coccomyxa sp. Obi]|nr:DNA-directed RNA polymerase II subunit RPB9 [Coccomyxa sp. Obi]
MSTGPKLKFCPESNDLLYPVEDRERRKLVYQCRNCGYREDAHPSSYCVYRNEITHTHKERTVILQDVRADPTLPRTKESPCPKCQHNEAVFFSESTEEGMTLFFMCCKCGNRWRDYV